jgi:DNA-binding NtrC family response regulator
MAKILIIDDDAIVRRTLATILEDDGHEVAVAEDGRQGMALFRSGKPDLVITDIVMPEQEGIQTITEMRQERPDAKIIAISGGGRIGDTDFLKIALVLGAADAIRKPFDSEELLTIVKACLAGRSRGQLDGQ